MLSNTQRERLLFLMRQRLVDEKQFPNNFKRQSVKEFNNLVIAMTTLFYDSEYVDLRVIEKYLQVKYFASEVAIRRKLTLLKAKELFIYDEDKRRFYLRPEIKTQLQLETQKPILGQDGQE